MNLTDADKKHLIGGSIAAASMTALLLLGIHVSGPLALAVGGPLFCWGIERYQAIRREGVASNRDIVLGSIPFWIAAAAWQVLA